MGESQTIRHEEPVAGRRHGFTTNCTFSAVLVRNSKTRLVKCHGTNLAATLVHAAGVSTNLFGDTPPGSVAQSCTRPSDVDIHLGPGRLSNALQHFAEPRVQES